MVRSHGRYGGCVAEVAKTENGNRTLFCFTGSQSGSRKRGLMWSPLGFLNHPDIWLSGLKTPSYLLTGCFNDKSCDETH